MLQRDYLNAVGMAKYYSHMYYVKSAPVVSDQEFDALIAQIEQAEQEHPEWTLPDSPTQIVGSDLFGGNGKVRHRTPMLSCQKAKTVAEVEKWQTKVAPQCMRTGKIVLSWKYDGISCSLVYFNGQLIEASTRGDGEVGQNILPQVMMMPSVPKQLKADADGQEALDLYHYSIEKSGRIEVRGEVVCPKGNLRIMRNQYADCRSAASGLCNMDVADPDCELLSFCVWGVECPQWNVYDYSQSSGRHLAGHLGFDECQYVCSGIDFPEQLERLINDYAAQRELFPFPTDGVVLTIDHKGDFRALGANQHHPHGSIAYKFAPAKAITRCTRIEITTGKTGKRTPVAYFEPVTILGREVGKASLYSEKTASELGIKRGSVIEVGLSNDITPKVYRVLPDDGDYFKADGNDPLKGVSFDGPVADEEYAAPGDAVIEPVENQTVQPEELYHPRSLFDDLDEEEEGREETVEVPTTEAPADPAPQEEETAAADRSPLGTALSVIAICIITVFGLALACFGIPLLAGSLKA